MRGSCSTGWRSPPGRWSSSSRWTQVGSSTGPASPTRRCDSGAQRSRARRTSRVRPLTGCGRCSPLRTRRRTRRPSPRSRSAAPRRDAASSRPTSPRARPGGPTTVLPTSPATAPPGRHCGRCCSARSTTPGRWTASARPGSSSRAAGRRGSSPRSPTASGRPACRSSVRR